MTLNLSLNFDVGSEGSFSVAKIGDGVLLGKLLELFKVVWPILAPILLEDKNKVKIVD